VIRRCSNDRAKLGMDTKYLHLLARDIQIYWWTPSVPVLDD
jgi:hypothetical protein